MAADLPISPPIEPMLARLAETLPDGPGFLFEPKWDGFRALVFRGRDDVYIQSRDLKPLDRYFPDVHEACLSAVPPGAVLDGEIVIAASGGLDFGALQGRLHPAASRVTKLARETPASFVAFDALAVDGRDVRAEPQRRRRQLLEAALKHVAPPVYLTPMTTDRAVAADWLARFEGAGLDGVIAKPEDAAYQPRRRVPAAGPLRPRRCAAARRRDIVVHDGTRAKRSCESWSRSARTRSPITRGVTGQARRPRRRGCLVVRRDGAPARICPGSRCDRTVCVK